MVPGNITQLQYFRQKKLKLLTDNRKKKRAAEYKARFKRAVNVWSTSGSLNDIKRNARYMIKRCVAAALAQMKKKQARFTWPINDKARRPITGLWCSQLQEACM